MKHVIPPGTSEPQIFELREVDGAGAEAFDGTGFTVAALFYQRVSGVLVLMSPQPALTVGWLAEASGRVSVTGTETLATGSYYVRFVVTDLQGTVGKFPNTEDLFWIQVPAA